jgi:hypothetical protein
MPADKDNGEKMGPAEDVGEALDLAGRRRRRFLVFSLLLVAALLGANFLYGTALFTRENRDYCLECHRLSGSALMWEPSDRHAAGVTCGQCHGLLPDQRGRCGAFSAHAETVNPNCMGCHSSVVQGRPLDKVVTVRLPASADTAGQPKVYRWRLEQLMYDWHLKKRICLCTDCHRNVSHEQASMAFGHGPKMAYCKACHYHAVKDDYVRISPLPMLEIKEGERAKAKGEREEP